MKNSRNYLSGIKLTLLLISFLPAFALSSCKKSEMDNKAGQVQVLEKNLLKSPDKYAELLSKRESGDSPAFRIIDINREGAILKIRIKGGCSEDSFKITWDGLILESYPAQVRLILNHEAATGCSPSNEFLVTVNLTKIIGAHDPKDFVFHIANGSVKEDKTLDPNGTVTTSP